MECILIMTRRLLESSHLFVASGIIRRELNFKGNSRQQRIENFLNIRHESFATKFFRASFFFVQTTLNYIAPLFLAFFILLHSEKQSKKDVNLIFYAFTHIKA